MKLCVQAPQRSLGQTVVEIRGSAGNVREPSAGVEGGASLVVDEQEGQVLRSRAGGQADDQRPEELALAGAGRPGHEHVGSVTHEIDLDRTVSRQRETGAERRIIPGGAPVGAELFGVVERAGDEIGERDDGREAPPSSGSFGIVESGEGECHPSGGGRRGAGRPDVLGQAVLTGALDAGRPVGSELYDGPARTRQCRHVFGHDERRGRRVPGQQPASRRVASGEQRRILDDEEQVRARGRFRRPVDPGEDRIDLGTGRHQALATGGVLGVGQPGQPRSFTGRSHDSRSTRRVDR